MNRIGKAKHSFLLVVPGFLLPQQEMRMAQSDKLRTKGTREFI
jgi:hypothetical protein